MLCDILTAGEPKIGLVNFNSKIGKENMSEPTIGSESLHEVSYDYGNKLITFAVARNVIISNTRGG